MVLAAAPRAAPYVTSLEELALSVSELISTFTGLHHEVPVFSYRLEEEQKALRTIRSDLIRLRFDIEARLMKSDSGAARMRVLIKFMRELFERMDLPSTLEKAEAFDELDQKLQTGAASLPDRGKF
jgi:hypothetical protein